MNIPQVSQKQYEILESAIAAFYNSSVDLLTWVVADEALDKNLYEGRKSGQDNVEGLVPMGLLEDVTELQEDYTKALTAHSNGRKWRIFRLSDLAHQMFAPSTSKTIH